MLENLTIQDIALFIGFLGVIFGVPFSIAKYTNSLKLQLKEMQTSIEKLETNFNNKIDDLRQEFNLKNKDILDELQRTTTELQHANSNNKILYKVVKGLIDFQVKNSQDAELKEIKKEFDEATINTATTIKL